MTYKPNSNYSIGAKTEGEVGFISSVTEENKFVIKEKAQRARWTKQQAKDYIRLLKSKHPEAKFTLFRFAS